MKKVIPMMAALLLSMCSPAFADGGKNYEGTVCPAPTVIYEQAEAADCPYVERTEKVYVNTATTIDREAYVLGMVGTGFSSTTGETNYGSIHDRDSEQRIDLGSDEDTRTLLIGYESQNGPFDFYEYGITTADSGYRTRSRYTSDLGLNARRSSLEAFAQGKKTFVSAGRFAVHGLAGLGLRSVNTEIDSNVVEDHVTTNSDNYTTAVARVGLGLSFDLSNRVAIVARSSWSHELNPGDEVVVHDRCWNDTHLSEDDDGLEASVGVRISF